MPTTEPMAGNATLPAPTGPHAVGRTAFDLVDPGRAGRALSGVVVGVNHTYETAVNLDGALWGEIGRVGLARPALQVLAPHPEFAVTPQEAVKAGMTPTAEWFEAERSIVYGGWRTVQQQAQPGYTFQLAGATHTSASWTSGSCRCRTSR